MCSRRSLGGSCTVGVDLAFDAAGAGASVWVVVVDDGRGFYLAEAGDGRFGRVGMRERAARIGEVLTFVTAPGEGMAAGGRGPRCSP